MASLEGQTIQNRFKDLLQCSNANSGIDSTKRAVSDGEGTASKLELSTTAVNVASGFELNGTAAQTGTLLKHEVGGLEFDASAIADGGVVVGTASGTMGIRAGFLTAGAAGFVKHELGGLEIDISAVTTDEFIVGQSAGVVAVRTAAQTRTHLSLVIGTNVQAFDTHLEDLAALSPAAGANEVMVSTGAGAWANESGATLRASIGVAIGTDVQAQDAVLDDLAALSPVADNEIIVGTGAGTYAHESGATLRDSIGLGTGDSPQFTGIEVGAASDTTLTRASAGNLNVEGNLIYRAGGTDVPVADGGTGASTLTNHGVVLGSGTSAVSVTGAGTSGDVLTSNGAAADPTYQTPAAGGVEAGTVMLFHQTAAPTGWTKDTAATLNNSALRVVTSTAWASGKQGATAFTSVFGSGKTAGNATSTGTVGNTTISTAQSPAHGHAFNFHTSTGGGSGFAVLPSGERSASTSDAESSVGSTGGGGSHNHSLTMNAHNHTLSLDLNYINFILATKD